MKDRAYISVEIKLPRDWPWQPGRYYLFLLLMKAVVRIAWHRLPWARIGKTTRWWMGIKVTV